jgi:hypothetical protein
MPALILFRGFPWLTGLSGFPGLSRLPRLSRLPLLPLLTAASGASTAASPVSTLATLVTIAFALAILFVGGKVGYRQSLGEIDLCTDGVGQVADHEDILNMVVEVVFNLRSVHLGGQ